MGAAQHSGCLSRAEFRKVLLLALTPAPFVPTRRCLNESPGWVLGPWLAGRHERLLSKHVFPLASHVTQAVWGEELVCMNNTRRLLLFWEKRAAATGLASARTEEDTDCLGLESMHPSVPLLTRRLADMFAKHRKMLYLEGWKAVMNSRRGRWASEGCEDSVPASQPHTPCPALHPQPPQIQHMDSFVSQAMAEGQALRGTPLLNTTAVAVWRLCSLFLAICSWILQNTTQSC